MGSTFITQEGLQDYNGVQLQLAEAGPTQVSDGFFALFDSRRAANGLHGTNAISAVFLRLQSSLLLQRKHKALVRVSNFILLVLH